MFFKKFIILFFLVSCSKTSYILDQSIGQIKLLNKARDNETVLKDVRVPKKHKEKIKLVEKYKKHFYEYWDKKETKLYSKTVILDQKAVTYLVIASEHNKVQALRHCFVFVGCFPYLGFFSEKKAKKFADELKEDGFSIYTRPVYAYSTLTRFTDPILSSFFYYSDESLAELIFHELFHTIFFIKDEVEINENLANYFGKEMMKEYFHYSKEKEERMAKELEIKREINKEVVKQVEILNDLYKSKKPQSRDESNIVFKEFMKNQFNPQISQKCRQLKVKNCYPLERKWNNASFAAYLTYEAKGDSIQKLRKKLGFNLKKLLEYINNKYQQYKNEENDLAFSSYLFKDL